MRRDCVTQVIVEWSNGEWENFATPMEAQIYINSMIDELDIPVRAWLEDMKGNKKWDYEILEDDSGLIVLVS